MRVLICGDRDWTDKESIRSNLSSLQDVEVVIEGEARGADSLGREVAEELDIPVIKFPAQWDRFGKAAGYLRNTHMLRYGQPDIVLAFHDNLEESKGTKDMVLQAQKAGVPVRIINHKE